MKRSGFKRPVYDPPAPPPAKRVSVRAAMVMAAVEPNPQPKAPADRNTKLRELARGEDCTVKRYAGFCRCNPDTTVWAHTNSLGDQKGMGYKGHDTAGFFAGSECHDFIDRRLGTPQEIALLVATAQARTRMRLREIAKSPSVKPWKRLAAIGALQQLEARGVR